MEKIHTYFFQMLFNIFLITLLSSVGAFSAVNRVGFVRLQSLHSSSYSTRVGQEAQQLQWQHGVIENRYDSRLLMCPSDDISETGEVEDNDAESADSDNVEISSREITRLEKRIEELKSQILSTKKEKEADELSLEKMDKEFGSEIARIKKEFARMKERSFEEATDISNKAKVDALKEVLPITDNYFRAKKVFEPLGTEGEAAIQALYDKIFVEFSKVIEDFGVVRVESVGQPFDFNFMEAIMTSPSTEYAADIVCTEYQVGYKMGDKCIRPAMVVVSTGPGPAK